MSKPTAVSCAANANKYLGISYSIMDCQAYIERLLADVGIQRNWAGSNAMFRDASSFMDMGTPEECRRRLGCIPVGAMLGIWQQNGAPAKYKDGRGNLSHIGIKTGCDKGAVHSSQSRGQVAQSVFEDKTVRNGGWNRVLLCRLLDYGADIEQAISGSAGSQASVGSTAGTAQSAAGTAVAGTLARPTLRRGKKGEEVKQLQQLLLACGYNLGACGADGDFGSATDLAVRKYQEYKGLKIDGIAGAQTWAALEAEKKG